MDLQASERLGLGPAVVHSERPDVIDPAAIRKLDLQPQEAFLLSRIDGPVSIHDLALMCGMDLSQILPMVDRLVRMRVLLRLDQTPRQSKTVKIPAEHEVARKVQGKLQERGNAVLRQRAKTRKMRMLRAQIHAGGRRSAPASRVPLVSVSVQPGQNNSRPAVQTQSDSSSAASRPPAPGGRPRSTTQPLRMQTPTQLSQFRWELVAIEEARLDDSLAIGVDRQRKLLQMSSLLDDLTPFELLAMQHSQDETEIRRAFHQQSRWLHPDAYHGKELGSYRELLECLFAKVRQAYDELQDEQARERYAASS